MGVALGGAYRWNGLEWWYCICGGVVREGGGGEGVMGEGWGHWHKDVSEVVCWLPRQLHRI